MLKTIYDVEGYSRIKILDSPILTDWIDGERKTLPTTSYNTTNLQFSIEFLLEKNPDSILYIYPDGDSLVHDGEVVYDPMTFKPIQKQLLRCLLIDKSRLSRPPKPKTEKVKIEPKKTNRLKYLLIK